MIVIILVTVFPFLEQEFMLPSNPFDSKETVPLSVVNAQYYIIDKCNQYVC